jgi:hypothetical protein
MVLSLETVSLGSDHTHIKKGETYWMLLVPS